MKWICSVTVPQATITELRVERKERLWSLNQSREL
jgi:hypothetical protein